MRILWPLFFLLGTLAMAGDSITNKADNVLAIHSAVVSNNFRCTGTTDIPMSHLTLSTTSTLANAGITASNIVAWTSIDKNFNFTINAGDTKVYAQRPGSYLVLVSMLARQGATEGANFRMWFRTNNVNLANSGTHVDFPIATGGTVITNTLAVVAVPMFISFSTTNDYFEVLWWSDSATMTLPHYDVGTSPARPASPAVIMTVNKVSNN